MLYAGQGAENYEFPCTYNNAGDEIELATVPSPASRHVQMFHLLYQPLSGTMICG